jgi:hypothetical protein
MERKKPQILTGVAVLVSATVLSFGVRHPRVIVHRARIADEPVVADEGRQEYSEARPVASAQNFQPREQVDIKSGGGNSK